MASSPPIPESNDAISREKNWHTYRSEYVLQRLQAGGQGLTESEVEHRRARFGPNELQAKEKESLLMMLLKQFTSFLVVLLIVAAVVSAVMGEVTEAVAIAAIVILAGVLGFLQESRAEKALDALKKMAAPLASVMRNGSEQEIPARDLVPGDIILLRVGDRVPADARLLEAVNLKAEEAPLTGESVPQEKMTEPIEGPDLPVGDRRNMVFMGTTVAYGRGKAVVAATGMSTEFGKIASMLAEAEERKTPLQESLDRTGRWLGIFALAVCAAIAIAGIIRGYGTADMFIWGVALAVAVIPEALPAVVTIGLALGVRRMVKRHALIRKLQAVETLGCASVICSDKTGTLTRDEMTVRRIWVDGRTIAVTGSGYEPTGEFQSDGTIIDPSQSPSLGTLLLGGALCNDSRIVHVDKHWDIRGDPTEGALAVVAAKAGLQQDDLATRYPREAEIPFSSETKRMTTIHTVPQGRLGYSKGAIEVIVESCSSISRNGQEIPFTPQDKESVLEIGRQWAGDALRVLGIAYKPLAAGNHCCDAEAQRDMVFVGSVGMIDPPREEVKGAIAVCREAGIKPVMITGDHKLTAVAIARELGLLKDGLALSGAELDKLSDAEFSQIVEEVDVYARTSPAHKMRIVDALTKKGHVVAMTGDGVNDAPALKKADIGIAMGISGTDVSREAAAMVLTDDNFASIVAAVEEGRSIYANIRKYLIYLLGGNMGAVIAMVVALLADYPLPLTAVQILFINLLMDGGPAVALGVEPPEPGIMKQPPRNPRKSIFDRVTLAYIGGVGVWIAIATFFTYLAAGGDGGPDQAKAMTIFFATLISLRLCNAFNCRSARNSVFRMGMFTNKWLIYAATSSFALMLMAIYVPALQDIFDTVSLNVVDWIVIVLVALSLLAMVEIAKLVMSWQARQSRGADQTSTAVRSA